MKKHSICTLIEAATRTLQNEGLSRQDSVAVAETLVDADVRGHRSHGLSLIPLYLRRVREGGIDVHAQPEWILESDSIAILDAHACPGQIAARLAAERCARLAARSGVVGVAIRNNNHIGMLAAYRGPFQQLRTIGLIFNIAGASVVPPGGIRATLGNNAICLVIPITGDEPFVIDFATGVVACGKIREAASRGNRVPAGWLIDRNGLPTTDPGDLDRGGAVPIFGGHKGLAVSMIVELLAGAIGGHITSQAVNRQRVYLDRPMRCSQFFIGISPSMFGVSSLDAYVEQLNQSVRDSYANEPPQGTYFPDEREKASRALAEREGVDVSSELTQILGL